MWRPEGRPGWMKPTQELRILVQAWVPEKVTPAVAFCWRSAAGAIRWSPKPQRWN